MLIRQATCMLGCSIMYYGLLYLTLAFMQTPGVLVREFSMSWSAVHKFLLDQVYM